MVVACNVAPYIFNFLLLKIIFLRVITCSAGWWRRVCNTNTKRWNILLILPECVCLCVLYSIKQNSDARDFAIYYSFICNETVFNIKRYLNILHIVNICPKSTCLEWKQRKSENNSNNCWCNVEVKTTFISRSYASLFHFLLHRRIPPIIHSMEITFASTYLSQCGRPNKSKHFIFTAHTRQWKSSWWNTFQYKINIFNN